MKLSTEETSLLETECLYGESVEIIKNYSDWVYCKLNTDSYYGWIDKNSLGKLKKATHRVIAIRSFIYKERNAKSDTLLYLPMGSLLALEEIHSDWAKISTPINGQIKSGYIPIGHIVKIGHKVSDWVNFAEKLKGTPYKWGGRDTLGLDCSALLQLSYQTFGVNIPRNSSQQVKLNKKRIDSISDLKRGCVVFWKGHVGIMIDNLNCLHSNAFHMKAVIEPLEDIINRMDIKFGITKMMDFN